MTAATLRPLTVDDLPAVLEIHHRSGAHDLQPWVLSSDELREELDDDHVVLATDTRGAELDGRLVGAVWTYHLPSEVREERCYVFGRVAPAVRGRGIGTALMTWAIERASEQLRSTGRPLPRFVRADAYEQVADAHRLFARVGMSPVRWAEELLRPLADLPAPFEVEGARIVPWPDDDDDRDEEIRAAKNAAFADHWGSTPTSAHHWVQMVRGPGARRDLSFVALDEHDRVVAHCLNKRFEADDAVPGRRDGWIDNLGTLQEWRGRGIASALVVRSLHAFAAAGLTHASIGVDADNPTGAARLYRALGFEVVKRSITHELEVV